MITQLTRQRPASWTWRFHLGAATASLGSGSEPLSRPAALLETDGRWKQALANAYATDSDLECARRLVELSLQADPTVSQQGQLLAQKIAVLTDQTAIADAARQETCCGADSSTRPCKPWTDWGPPPPSPGWSGNGPCCF